MADRRRAGALGLVAAVGGVVADPAPGNSTGDLPVPGVKPRTAFTSSHGRTTISKLVLTGVPAGGKVKVSCKGRGCRFASRTVKARKGRANLTKLVRTLKLAKGAEITIRTSAPGHLVAITRIRITKKGPKVTRVCAVPGAQGTVACG